jgi:hypothetical protein
MDDKTMQEIFHEFISSLEAMDTQSSAISEFLKDKGIASQKELAPYLERAGNASNVRWLGTRVRIDYLFATDGNDKSGDASENSSDTTHPASETVQRSVPQDGPENGKAEGSLEKKKEGTDPSRSADTKAA